MPPPPPPSASYNLVIEDSSSEEEEEDDDQANYYRRRNHYMNMVAATGAGGAFSPSASIASNNSCIPNHGSGLLSYTHHTGSVQINSAATSSCSKLLPPQDEKMEVDNEIIISMQVDEKQFGRNEDEEGMAIDGGSIIDSTGSRKKKRKKKKKKKKAKKSCNDSLGEEEVDDEEDVDQVVEAAVEDVDIETTTNPPAATSFVAATTTTTLPATAVIQHQLPKKSPSKSISFGTVSVEHYARTLGTHVVPLDGGWPLGLSNRVIVPGIAVGRASTNDVEMDVTGGAGVGSTTTTTTTTPLSSPSQRNRLASSSPKNNLTSSSSSSFSSTLSISSPDTKNHTTSLTSTPHITFTIDDFEARKQIELQQRYIQLVRDQRRRKFEKEWEKKHMNKNIHHNHGNNNNHHHTRRNRGGKSGSGVNGGKNRSISGSYKMEMSSEDKEELERIVNQPIAMPTGELETRPFDYKKKICHALKQHRGCSASSKDCHGDKNDNNMDHTAVVTEEDELYHEQRGRNPLFVMLTENARRKLLLRDDHLMNICQAISDDNANIMMNDHESNPLDPADTATTQHIQHELETLRIQRSDPANLGCSCRKLHVFLPNSIDKSHHKKKGSHRRMPERKVCEELRRRGLLNKSNENMSREKMEVLLHDTIEKEPCCWGNDCPCVKNGIGCQADTCSCWHASHDVAHGSTTNLHSASETHDQGMEVMKSRCGNVNGMYIVNFEEIAEYRKRYVAAKADVEK